jgi:hypothetical protein
MELLITIKDSSKVAHILSILEKYAYVKVKPLSPYKAQVLGGIKKSVDEVNLIRSGKLKGISAEKLLNEL